MKITHCGIFKTGCKIDDGWWGMQDIHAATILVHLVLENQKQAFFVLTGGIMKLSNFFICISILLNCLVVCVVIYYYKNAPDMKRFKYYYSVPKMNINERNLLTKIYPLMASSKSDLYDYYVKAVSLKSDKSIVVYLSTLVSLQSGKDNNNRGFRTIDSGCTMIFDSTFNLISSRNDGH